MTHNGLIRVGRIIYKNGKPIYPSFPGFEPIVVLTKSSKYGSLGPYELKDEKGRIFENWYQFQKIYEWVPETKQTYSRWDNTVIWEYPYEVHVKDGIVTDKYWNWRNKGMNSLYPIRYPVGNTKHRSLCLGSIKEEDHTILNYIESRKQLYLAEYVRLVRQKDQYKTLVNKHNSGQNLLIIEIDGPHEESLNHYKKIYNVSDDFIVNNTMLITPDNINIMLNDSLHPFGHGYCLAMSILNMI